MTTSSSAFLSVPLHLVVKGVFGQEMADSLVSYAVSNESEFKTTWVKRADGDGPDPSFRISSSLPEWPSIQIAVKRRMSELFPALSAEVGTPPFELESIELEFVAHGDGAFFGRHIDTFTRAYANIDQQRILSAVYYFHSRPKGFSGGSLRLFALGAAAGRDAAFVDIDPEHDTLVVFPSWVPHEVRKVSCPSGSFADSRFAINCWFCRKTGS